MAGGAMVFATGRIGRGARVVGAHIRWAVAATAPPPGRGGLGRVVGHSNPARGPCRACCADTQHKNFKKMFKVKCTFLPLAAPIGSQPQR
eukprot:scaffold19489_cov110-Isochrysis_galbana.AAC.2